VRLSLAGGEGSLLERKGRPAAQAVHVSMSGNIEAAASWPVLWQPGERVQYKL